VEDVVRRSVEEEAQNELMEIQALRLVITEQDFDQIVARVLPEDLPVKDLRLQVRPDGVHVLGSYPMVVNVAFEAIWTLAIQEGKLAAHLADFKVVGLGGGLLKPMLMNAIGGALKKREGVRVEGETILVEPDVLFARKGLEVRTNLTGVHCEAGTLVIEAGVSPG
jgi:hypothetical protein